MVGKSSQIFGQKTKEKQYIRWTGEGKIFEIFREINYKYYYIFCEISNY